MITASQIKYFATRFEKTDLVILSFLVKGLCVLAVPVTRNFWGLGVVMLVFGLANGIISPTQKSLLTQSAPGELRGGIVSADRLLQSLSKTVSPPIAGLILTLSNLETVFLALAAIVLVWVSGAWLLRMRGYLKAAPIH